MFVLLTDQRDLLRKERGVVFDHLSKTLVFRDPFVFSGRLVSSVSFVFSDVWRGQYRINTSHRGLWNHLCTLRGLQWKSYLLRFVVNRNSV